jgi:hypothetical protein
MRTYSNISRDEVLDGLHQTWEQSMTTFDEQVVAELINAFLESDALIDMVDVIDAVYDDTSRMSSKMAMYTKDCIDDILDYFGAP